MRNLIEDTIIKLKALQLGLEPSAQEDHIFHYRIAGEADEDEVLNKMSEFEANGFFYQGISKMVGDDGYMIFSCRPRAQMSF